MPLPDVVAMQTRQPNLESAGEIPLRRLVEEALRMRPSRIVVGEVRQEESASTCRRTPWTYGGSPSVAAPGCSQGRSRPRMHGVKASTAMPPQPDRAQLAVT
jgi:hypothetical protein